MRASETAEMIFQDCRIHKDQLLGKEGDGFIQAMKILDGGRISIGALSLGIAKGAYEASLKYAKERDSLASPSRSFRQSPLNSPIWPPRYKLQSCCCTKQQP